MKFTEVLPLLKAGKCFKRPSWRGYWCWDNDKETIIMHVQPSESDTGKPLMDIRESKRVEYTLTNLLAEDWVEATIENTPLLGGEAMFDFNTALKYLNRGFKLKRKLWSVSLGRFPSYIYCDLDANKIIASHFTNPFGDFTAAFQVSLLDVEATDWMFFN